MIDYEKLKEAHELARFYAETKNIRCDVAVSYESSEIPEAYVLYFENHWYTDNLDELIKKLKELTNPEPKYKVGQLVWFIDCTKYDGPICDGVIEKIGWHKGLFNEDKCYAQIGDKLIPEDCLYPSRQALIEAQIEYWTDLKKEIEQIKAQIHRNELVDKCKHCGEFYR